MPDNLELRNLLALLSPERRPRRERPELEALECRALMAFDFSAGYQILGMGVAITAVGTDSKGEYLCRRLIHGRRRLRQRRRRQRLPEE